MIQTACIAQQRGSIDSDMARQGMALLLLYWLMATCRHLACIVAATHHSFRLTYRCCMMSGVIAFLHVTSEFLLNAELQAKALHKAPVATQAFCYT